MEHINVVDQPDVRRGKIINFASILEPKTREQAMACSVMPFVHPHVALMPDAHLGMGATVGSVIPTERAIMPAAIGVDIGCGMIAVRTQYGLGDLPGREQYGALRETIEAAIPVSKGGYNVDMFARHTETRLTNLYSSAERTGFDPRSYDGNWEMQLGTLGSGNHFIEVSLDEEDRVWLFLHSGSRGVGNKIAQRWIKVAKQQCERWHVNLPNPDLAYLIEGTDEFWTYIKHMTWAQEFAWENRAEMMDRVVWCFERWLNRADEVAPDEWLAVEPERTVNCHHNYTQREHHFNRDVWVSRKGAISAQTGQWGLIPGSMGTRSYVVTGKGYAPSLSSAPHGAGREYSRTAARKAFTEEDLVTAMGDIEYRKTDAFIDEIPAAYKDIDVVMKDAEDLVEVQHTLRQLVNVKGD